MPTRPKKPCAHPRCPNLVDRGRCADHQRETAAERGYDAQWQRARARFLIEHPLCEMECLAEGRVTAATVVDHIVPHRGNQQLFWDESNWQAGCKTCHDRKTARGL